MAQTIDGKAIAREIESLTKDRLEKLITETGAMPKLVSIMIGHQKEAQLYMNMQKKLAVEIGIEFNVMKLDENISQTELLEKIEDLNRDKTVTSVILQRPLPKGINHDVIISKILPEKDAEGIHPCNLGRILRREADIVPCTPGAVMKILRVQKVDLYGKNVVIIGHSAIVGKPLSLMMLNETATTTVCHIGTAEKGNIIEHAKKADVLVVAVGKPKMVKSDWVKEGAVVVDVGINNVNGEIVGDVDFSEASKKASMITPVPGGVGPVTVAILMRNVLRGFKAQNE
ncbi:MAG: bifunctional 5,10-methylenetetrahydrofolate dehydrogenase/5,10-methenyltetrahydrofolate cyclohydrolase [Candidatus Omnitrophota bacterium]|jgi:methylenetetrahydrofolate dehydrogenase (NADP+)/methenyltetrahydrofolate cyclohydrolase